MKRLLLNGNIEMTVQLLPTAYAALTAAAERDGGSYADVINVAILTYGAVSAAAAESDKKLSSEVAES